MAKPPGAREIFRKGLFDENPVLRQILGICSALAVTNLLLNTAIMSLALIFTTAMSSATVSLLRDVTPPRVRMMVQVLIIACYVIIVDIALQAWLPDVSRQLGPYVGLIITNCIVMGRAEGFAVSNPPLPSFLDGVACGAGYGAVLMAVAFIRELTGAGTLFGLHVMPGWWVNWTIMVMPPAAFFVLGTFLWVVNSRTPKAGAK
jgi:Na+-transporting NADH:ubiquinone oxidoreductase subunit D